MLSLDSPEWGRMQHAYGSAEDIPNLLRQLTTFPPPEGEGEPWFSIWSALAHQGDVYPASFAAVPHIMKIFSSAPDRSTYDFFFFPAWVEICRHRHGTVVPDELSIAYYESLSELPRLIAAAASQEWFAESLPYALSAFAVGKGFPVIAEAVLEIDNEVATEFLKWFHSR